MQTLELLLALFASYLWGAIPTAFIVTQRRAGIDLRRYGTGTIGGANAGEQMGTVWKFIIAGLDLLKGMAPVACLRALGADPWLMVLSGAAVVAGHNWSPYIGWAGGRGLAAAIGTLFVWDARLPLFLLCFFWGGQLARHRGEGPAAGFLLLTLFAWLLDLGLPWLAGCALLALIIAAKRLEGNRLPLPTARAERLRVLWRRFWLDRDVPLGQPWEERRQFR
ncbi:MAG: glycerol-3-phosphate acyltransferase [Chloroflexi bacterium]|nr:glycerol-3-phosphate acyltransferase [Chloroflexota bacterium]